MIEAKNKKTKKTYVLTDAEKKALFSAGFSDLFFFQEVKKADVKQNKDQKKIDDSVTNFL